MTGTNPLLDSGLPLFFRVANPLQTEAPESRLGDSVRTLVRSLSHMQKEALVYSPRSGNTWRLASDEGAYLDGLDAAPCPLCFMTTGMVVANMNEIIALAAQRSIELRHIRLIQDNYYTMTGSMLRGTMTGGAKNVALAVELDADADAVVLQQLVEDAVRCNPVYGLLDGAQESLFALSHNGRALQPQKNRPVAAGLIPEVKEAFHALQAAPSALGALVSNTGRLTPRAAHTTSSQGSSLAAEQNRLLHIRGICTLRADGVREVEQHLFNPQGSIYRLLSEEAPVKGGQGRAPDAVSYLSAGIAFCFMTQFGRAASIFKKPLNEYAILQDTFFSPGAASEGDGMPVEADPVETHAWLHSDFDDDYAQHVLAMAEQSCFLHALCRTALATEVTVRTVKA